jgi:hypothetical protein
LALTPANNDAFFREVDEELRRDRLNRFGKRWGVAVIVGIVVLLVAFGGWLYWQHRQTQRAGVEGEQMQAAFDALAAANPAAATQPLAALQASSSEAYRGLAIFTQADILLQKDDLRGAAAKFATVAADAGMPQSMRDLATVRQSAAEFDLVKPQVLVDRLRPLAVAGSPWLGSAGEMLGAAYLKLGQRDQAAQTFSRIAAGKDVPETIRQRAVQMAGVLSAPVPAAAQPAPAQDMKTR